MKRKYKVRDNFKDIFGVYLLHDLYFAGDYDMPIVGNFDDLSLIDYFALYSDLKDYCKTENTCVCFYQYDSIFDGIHGLYNSIIYQDKTRLGKFKERFARVKYIVAPDYSLFGDFPVALQIFNIYKSRICMSWLIMNTSASIIPNVRFTHDYTYNFSLDGISRGSNIAISILGLIRNKKNLKMFMDGFKVVIDRIQPKQILLYGFINKSILENTFYYVMNKGITFIIPHSKIDKYKNRTAIYGKWQIL